MINPRRTSLRRRTGRHVTKIPFTPRMSKARSFVSLSDKLNALNDEYVIAREVVDGLMAILHARAGLIMIPAPADLTYSKHRDRSEILARFERTLGERGDIVLPFFSLEPHRHIHESDGLILVPLSWQGQTIGLVAFDRDGRMPAASEEAGLLALCNQLAAILGLKRELLQALGEPNLAIPQQEIDNAVAMQQSLQPSIPSSRSCGLSIATHTQSAEYLGGDYFDLMIVDQNKMGIVIADVEGKGVSAALFGNMLRTTVHFLTRESPSTAVVVGKINSILHKEAVALQKLFTMFYAVYDPTEKIMTYTGSGHVAPIVLRAGVERAERLPSDGTLIGIEPAQRFAERSIQLHAGDLVAFFTDGVIEHQNETGQTFGDHRLLQLLQAHRTEAVENIMKTLLTELSRFTPQPPADDLTVILTKIL